MSKTETLLGLTPVQKRMAHYYLCSGYGEYTPQDHPQYDKVIVRELYPFGENPRKQGEHAGGAVVEFYREDRKVKWIEFRCQVVGGGGEAVIRRVK